MNVFGYQLSITLVLQIVTTVAIVGLYATMTSLREQRADHLSDSYMVVLASFLFNHHPTVKDLMALSAAPESLIKKRGTPLYYFGPRMIRFLEAGELPNFQLAAKTTLWEHLIAVLFAPVAAIFVVFFTIDGGRGNAARVTHTEYRKNIFSKLVLLLAVNVLVVIASTDILPSHIVLGSGVAILGIVGILAALVSISIIAAQQQEWKRYWSDRFLEIMASATHEGNHDLFNRAMILNTYIESQPDVPIPGRIGFYTAMYTGVQALIVFGAKVLNF